MPVLTTSRLSLRELRTIDFEPVYKMLSDPDVMRYVDDGKPKTSDQVETLIATMQGLYRSLGIGEFAVIEQATQAFIGLCGFIPPTTTGAEAEISYLLQRRAWNRGYGLEMAHVMLDWGRTTHGFGSVLATIDPDNSASVRIALHLGMHFVRSERDEFDLPTDVYLRVF